MFAAFILGLYEHLRFSGRLILSVFQGSVLLLPWRIFVFLFVWCALSLLNLMHWLGFLVDEIIFFNYRKVDVKRPLFVLGIPRSGTTWLQRVLALDESLTSLTLWECILAPSVSERFLWKAITVVLKPISYFLSIPAKKLLRSFDGIHELGFNQAEEDFILLLPLQACFLMVLMCPNSSHYWQLARFDNAVPPRKKKVLMQYYFRCCQKHLYYHGSTKRFLSKNPSFTPFIQSLARTFDKPEFIACIRSPYKVVASQLSSLMPAIKLLGQKTMSSTFRDNMLGLLVEYYEEVSRYTPEYDILVVEMSEITQNLKITVAKIYMKTGLVFSNDYAEALTNLEDGGRSYKSKHQYTLDTFSLSEKDIEKIFSDVWPIT